MKHALVINLTRFGDLIQTQAVIDDLHLAGFTVDLICQKNFGAAVELLRNTHKAWLLPGSRLLSELDSHWQRALATFTDFLKPIKANYRPDAILNLTPTLPARLLSYLLADSKTRVCGFGMDEFGYGINHGVWASFFAVAANKRGNSPFNLADLMRRMALPLTLEPKGSFQLAKPCPDAQKEAERILEKVPEGARFIAFQLGASQDSRRWPVDKFRELGDIVWKKTGRIPILLGSPAEKQHGIEYSRNCAHPFIDAIGQTNIPVLGALLAKADALVTNDTGTMHLAAGLCKPVLAIFLATAQPWDTGPLMPGSFSLEPALSCHPCAFDAICSQSNRCRNLISAKTAASYLFALLDGSQLPANLSREARAWRAIIDDARFTTLVPLGEIENGQGAWLLWQKIFWQALLEDLESPSNRPLPELQRLYENLPDLGELKKLASTFLEASGMLKIIADLGTAALSKPKMGEIFLHNCERLQSLLDASDCSALGAFWREFRLNQGEDLERFARQTAIMAKHVSAMAKSMA